MTKPKSANQLVVIDGVSMGPAMQALPSKMMRDFVVALVTTGCSATDAAAAAGYSASSRAILSARGHDLISDIRIQAAILEQSQRLIRASGPMALAVIINIAKDESAAPRDRLKAATEILNRGGMHAVSESHLTVSVQTEAEKNREIEALAAELGLDDNAKARLLGRPIIEAEFTEIKDPPSDIAPKVGPQGRKITNPERTAEDRARDRLHKRETPEEKEARREQTRAEQRAKAKAEYAAAAALRGEPEPIGGPMAEAPDGPFMPAGSGPIPPEWAVWSSDATRDDEEVTGSTAGLEGLL